MYRCFFSPSRLHQFNNCSSKVTASARHYPSPMTPNLGLLLPGEREQTLAATASSCGLKPEAWVGLGVAEPEGIRGSS